MPNLTLVGWLFLAWGIVTAALAIVLIYRSTLSMKEDDQLFLDPAESHLEKEQQGLIGRMNQLRPYIQGLGATSAALLLAMLGVFVYRVMKAF